VLRQLPLVASATSSDRLYEPAAAVRIDARADKGPNPGSGPESVLPGAQIDYYLAPGASGPVTLTIQDSAGHTVRSFTSAEGSKQKRGSDGGLNRYRPTYATLLDDSPGMHRFIWDLRYSDKPEELAKADSSASSAREESEGGGGDDDEEGHQPLVGPVAVPGKYTVVMHAGSFTAQQPLTIVEDPRVSGSGVTDADLTAQFELQMRTLTLVNDTNLDVTRLNHALEELKTHPNRSKEKGLKAIADQMLTPKIRYSQPGLQTHVTYLYSEIGKTDQRPGRDSTERYQELRQKIDTITARLDELIGPVTTADIDRFLASDFLVSADDDDDDEQ